MILLLIISLVNAKLIAPRKVHYAIDCGSNSDTRTSAGIKFLKDKNYQGNSFAIDYHQEIGKQKIKFTDDIQLYETQREGLDFIYNIPIPTQQKQNWYVLILKFAELKYNLPSERVFQVLLGEKLILQNIDIISLVGNYTALTEYIEIYIENNQVFYQGEECNNAINNKNELTLRFVGEKNQATIAGLFLFIGSIDQTDWEDKLQNQEIWLKRNTVDLKQQSKQQAKQHEEILKEKQNIIKIREGFAHELPIEEIEKPQKNKLPIFSLELLFLMLKTPLGVVLSIGFLTVCYVSISFLFFNPYNIKVPEKQRTIKKD